jgi:short-subunit dehydrogenase
VNGPGVVLVLGATSGIARAVALELGRAGHPLCLAARDGEELAAIASDACVRTGTAVETVAFEASAPRAVEEAWARASAMGPVEGCLVAFGALGDQAECEADDGAARHTMEANYVQPALAVHSLVRLMGPQGEGWIAVLGSVAGDRGRRSNYVYGSAKGGLAAFLQGVRARVSDTRLRIVTVKPGPVDTAMTFGMGKLPLLAQPGDAAREIVRAIQRGREVVYVPGAWRLVMAVLRAIPEGVFKRLRL